MDGPHGQAPEDGPSRKKQTKRIKEKVKNAGKVKARRQNVFNKNTDNHYRAILGHARFLEPEVRKTISDILK